MYVHVQPRNRRDPRAAPAGIAAAVAAMRWGPRNPEQRAPARRSKSRRALQIGGFAVAWARRMRVAVGPLRMAAAADDQARRVGAGPRRLRGVHGRTFREAQPLSRTFRAGARKATCAGECSFGYFSCTSKKSDSFARRASESPSWSDPGRGAARRPLLESDSFARRASESGCISALRAAQTKRSVRSGTAPSGSTSARNSANARGKRRARDS